VVRGTPTPLPPPAALFTPDPPPFPPPHLLLTSLSRPTTNSTSSGTDFPIDSRTQVTTHPSSPPTGSLLTHPAITPTTTTTTTNVAPSTGTVDLHLAELRVDALDFLSTLSSSHHHHNPSVNANGFATNQQAHSRSRRVGAEHRDHTRTRSSSRRNGSDASSWRRVSSRPHSARHPSSPQRRNSRNRDQASTRESHHHSRIRCTRRSLDVFPPTLEWRY
jgi:hypothetical protein